MQTYIRVTQKLGSGKVRVSRYKPGEYIIVNIIKFFLYLFIFWPIEICLKIFLFVFLFIMEIIINIIRWIGILIWKIITLPFRLIFKK